MRGRRLTYPPTYILEVFNRLLALQDSIDLKRNYDKLQLKLSKSVDSKSSAFQKEKFSISHISLFQLWLLDWKNNKLKSAFNRIKYGSIPFVFLFLLTVFNNPNTFRNIELFAIMRTYLVLTFFTTILLTFIHQSIPWRKRSKLFKHYVFFSGCWILSTMVYREILLDSYDRDIEQSFLFALIPPLISGFAIYIYKNFVETNDEQY